MRVNSPGASPDLFYRGRTSMATCIITCELCGKQKEVQWNNRQQRYCSHQCAGLSRTPPIIHGHCRDGHRSPEYQSWHHMKGRCLNPNEDAYARYGGRGITVCDRWLHSFAAFLADMGPRPSSGHTIERLDNSKGYSPDNCVWATWIEQENNRKDNREITFQGRTLTLAQWVKVTGICWSTIAQRLKRGWSAEKTLTTPVWGLRRSQSG